MVNLQCLSFRVDGRNDIFELESLANLESLAQEVDVSICIHQTDEANLPNRDGELLPIQAKVGGQLAQLPGTPVLCCRLMTRAVQF
jgi:hypothetical protein